jgi:hypothetical protein
VREGKGEAREGKSELTEGQSELTEGQSELTEGQGEVIEGSVQRWHAACLWGRVGAAFAWPVQRRRKTGGWGA